MAFNLSLNLNKTNQIVGLALANVEALAVGEIHFDYICSEVIPTICFTDDDGTSYWGKKIVF